MGLSGPRSVSGSGRIRRANDGPYSAVMLRALLDTNGGEGLRVSLGAAKEKLAQTDVILQRRAAAVELGMPAFPNVVARTVTT